MTQRKAIPMWELLVASASTQLTPPPEETQPGLAPQPEEKRPTTADKGKGRAKPEDTHSGGPRKGRLADCCGNEWTQDVFRARDPPPRPEPGQEKWVVFIINYPNQRVLENKAFAEMVAQMECDLNIIEEDVPRWHPQLTGRWTIAAIPIHIFRPPYSEECKQDLWDYVVERLKLDRAEGLMYYTQREWDSFIGGDVMMDDLTEDDVNWPD